MFLKVKRTADMYVPIFGPVFDREHNSRGPRNYFVVESSSAILENIAYFGLEIEVRKMI